MKTLTFSVVVFAVLCSSAHAQQQGGMPETVVTELAYFVGDWTVEGNLAGKALKGHWSAQWAPEKQCLLTGSHFILGDEEVSSNGITGWDAGKEEVVTVQFVSNGVLEDFRYTFASPGVLKGVYTISPLGKQLKVTCEARTKQPNEWTFMSTVNVFERKKAAEFTLHYVRSETKSETEQVVSPAYEHLKDLEDFVGNWVAEDTLTEDMPGFAKKGEMVTYRASICWIHNKSILQIDFVSAAPDGKTVDARWNFGWDAVNKKIVYSGFDGLGGRVWGETRKEKPDKWIWENKWSGADGTQGSGTATTTILDTNNTHVHELTNGVVDGKPQPDGKLVYKRVK